MEIRLANEETLDAVARAGILTFVAMHADHMHHSMQTLLRFNDRAAPGAVLIPRAAREWAETATANFIDANILSQKNAVTLTAICLQQLQQRRQFYYGTKVAVLAYDREETKEALLRMGRIVAAQKELLSASIDPRILEFNFEYFDLGGWIKIGAIRDTHQREAERSRMLNMLKKLITAHQWPVDALLSATDVLRHAAQRHFAQLMKDRPYGTDESEENNRDAWTSAFDDTKAANEGRIVPYQDDLMAWVVNFSRSTSHCERLLQEDKAVDRKRTHMKDYKRRDVVALRRYPPNSLQELATRRIDGGTVAIVPLPILERSVQCRRRYRGSRFGVVQKIRSDLGEAKGFQEGSRAHSRKARQNHMLYLAQEKSLEKQPALHGLASKLETLQYRPSKMPLNQKMRAAIAKFKNYQSRRLNEEDRRALGGKFGRRVYLDCPKVAAAKRTRALNQKLKAQKEREEHEMALMTSNNIFVHSTAEKEVFD